MNRISVVGILSAALMLLAAGCASNYLIPMQQARVLINKGKAECVLIKDGRIIAEKSGGGVSPLLSFYDESPKMLNGSIVVDKVIGRAAAFIAISAGASHVHGEVMSSDAESLLTKHGISSSHHLLVPRILNRNRSGLCPLEKSVSGIEDPAKALASLRRAIAKMQKSSVKK